MIYLLYFLVAAALAALDQLSKYWVVTNFELYESMELLPGFMRLTYIHNTGASFSMLSDSRTLLLILTVLCAAVVIFMLFSKEFAHPLCRWSMTVLLGGALGNMIDRFRLGYVVDMFDLEFIDFPIFNVADCFICVGIFFFALYIIFEAVNERRRAKAAAEVESDENDKT